MGFSSRGDFGPEEVAFTTVLRGDSRRFERTHFACTLVLRFKRLERVETTKTQGLSQGLVSETTQAVQRRLHSRGQLRQRCLASVPVDGVAADLRPRISPPPGSLPATQCCVARPGPDARRVKPIAPLYASLPSPVTYPVSCLLIILNPTPPPCACRSRGPTTATSRGGPPRGSGPWGSFCAARRWS